MKLAIVGSREFTDFNLLEKAILEKYDINEITEIVSGGARGADTLAEEFAKKYNKELTVFKAEWDKYGKSAGYKRNVFIVDHADAVIAFPTPDSKGTRHTINITKEAGKPIEIIEIEKEKGSTMKFEMSEIGKESLKKQAGLAEEYGYKKLPDKAAGSALKYYIDNLPEDFALDYDKSLPLTGFTPGLMECAEKPGFEIEAESFPMFSRDGTFFARGFDRIVVGHYGAFIEIDPKDMLMDAVKVKPGQEYRINDEKFRERVKYQWFTTKDNSDCKLYFQQKGVTYADYRPNKWYISPYEVLEKKEIEQLKEADKEDYER